MRALAFKHSSRWSECYRWDSLRGMHIRRITRFHPTRSVGRNPSWWHRLQLRGGTLLLSLAIAAICLGLVCVPLVWAAEQVSRVNAELSPTYSHDLTRVEEHWVNLPRITNLKQGDEPHIQEMLASHPLLVAVLDRNFPERLWVRKDHRLVPGTQEADHSRYLQWITQAVGGGNFRWMPPLPLNTDPTHGPALVLLGERWIVIKRWVVGSPEVERMFRLILGPNPGFRAGIRLTVTPPHSTEKPEPWGAEPNLQADPARLAAPWFAYNGTSPTLEGWDIVAIPFQKDSKALYRQVLRQVWGGAAVAATVGICLGLGLWLRRRVRRRALLDADRLASLTHSLKTPLAILKFRCDSIRLGRLDRDQTDAELIKVGEEVDHLTQVIQNGLEAIHGNSEAGPQGEVSQAWLASLADDLTPAFQAENRQLRLELASNSGRAALPSLRSALLTLLENALYHGGGQVTFQTLRQRRRLQIRVQNEGPGLHAHQLEALGKPFMRIRNQGGEGFEHEGQGLGLSLLIQVAQKEGWGLTFASAPDAGFLATIEIRAI